MSMTLREQRIIWAIREAVKILAQATDDIEDNTLIDSMEWSVRARAFFKNAGVRTLGDLMMMTESEVLSFKNVGQVTLCEIRMKLAERGLRMRGEKRNLEELLNDLDLRAKCGNAKGKAKP